MNARSKILLVMMMSAFVFAFATGCGDDSDADGEDSDASATTVTTSSLSKAAFIKKANAVCEQERTKILNSTAPLPKGVMAVYVPAYESLIVGVRDLGAPSGDEAEVEAFLAAMQEDTESLEKLAPKVKSFGETEDPFKDSAALAKKYGLSRCTFYARYNVS